MCVCVYVHVCVKTIIKSSKQSLYVEIEYKIKCSIYEEYYLKDVIYMQAGSRHT